MIKFYKSHDPENHFDVSDVLLQIPNDSNLDEICETFERFLRACSFCFNGQIGIIEDEGEE
jgi:hypothetical protein